MHTNENESTCMVDEIYVTRLDWALSTALNDLSDDDASHFSKKPNSEKLVQGLNDFKELFNGYDSGICYIAKTTKCTNTESDTEETDTRLSGRVGKKVEINTNWFSTKDRFEPDIYKNIKDPSDDLDFRSDRQNCGLNSVPESVMFFYLNLPKLKKVITTLANMKQKRYECNMNNRGSITNSIHVKVYFGPIKWVNKHFFKWKRFILNISFTYVNDDKVSGAVIEVEESRELEVKTQEQINFEAEMNDMFDEADKLNLKQMELTRSDKGLGE